MNAGTGTLKLTGGHIVKTPLARRRAVLSGKEDKRLFVGKRESEELARRHRRVKRLPGDGPAVEQLPLQHGKANIPSSIAARIPSGKSS